jgi:hypothetical protein
MSLLDWTERSPVVLQQGGVIAPDLAADHGHGHTARNCHVRCHCAGTHPDGF